MPSGHGKVKVTVFNNERPLPSPVSKSVDLIDSQQTKMFYDSYLSIDCIPDVDYSTKFLRVNGEDKPIDV